MLLSEVPQRVSDAHAASNYKAKDPTNQDQQVPTSLWNPLPSWRRRKMLVPILRGVIIYKNCSLGSHDLKMPVIFVAHLGCQRKERNSPKYSYFLTSPLGTEISRARICFELLTDWLYHWSTRSRIGGFCSERRRRSPWHSGAKIRALIIRLLADAVLLPWSSVYAIWGHVKRESEPQPLLCIGGQRLWHVLGFSHELYDGTTPWAR